MKSDAVYKRAFNQMLDVLAERGTGEALPSESELGMALGVSRTTVRKVLAALLERRLIKADGRARVVAMPGRHGEAFPLRETVSAATEVERRFMEWMLRGDTKPGTLIFELELARQFGVATTGIREFLNRFSRFGLIEKRPNSGWMFKGFTEAFALELFEIRELFELRSALAFARLPPESPLWPRLAAIADEHRLLLETVETNFHDFSDLDNRFHRLITEASPNRFIDDFYDIITLIFHYHYQWNKRDEQQRNRAAIEEHLRYIEALGSRDPARVEAAGMDHLRSARLTLLLALAD